MIALVGDTNPYVKLLRANLGQQLGKRTTLVEVSETTLTDELSARGVVWFPIDCVLAVSVKADRGGSALSWFAGHPHIVRLASQKPSPVKGSVQSVWASESEYLVSVVRRGYAVQISEQDLWGAMAGHARDAFFNCGLGVITDIANTNAVCCSAHSFKQRLARVLIEAHQVFPALEPLTLTQKRIGTFLLTRRETVALLIEEWRREGILATFRGAIVVNDMERLRNESCACYQRVALARQRLLASWSSILLRSRGPSANPHAIDVRVSPPTLKATAVSTQG